MILNIIITFYFHSSSKNGSLLFWSLKYAKYEFPFLLLNMIFHSFIFQIEWQFPSSFLVSK